jgi:hypothetical protein
MITITKYVFNFVIKEVANLEIDANLNMRKFNSKMRKLQYKQYVDIGKLVTAIEREVVVSNTTNSN